MSAPKRLVIEYDDGTTKEIDFAGLDEASRDQLAKLARRGGEMESTPSKHYLVLRWKDGWQEVLAVDRDAVELIRYYVITRIEDRARLSFDAGEDWPRLHTIKRMPREVKDLLIVSADSPKLCGLEADLERWEGTFEAGGKREYVKYDRTNDHAPRTLREAPEELSRLVEAIRRQLADRGMKPQAVLTMDWEARLPIYRELARSMGFRAMEQQEDVYGLIGFLLGRAGQ